jgi:epimerase transport system membrane fusion protein
MLEEKVMKQNEAKEGPAYNETPSLKEDLAQEHEAVASLPVGDVAHTSKVREATKRNDGSVDDEKEDETASAKTPEFESEDDEGVAKRAAIQALSGLSEATDGVFEDQKPEEIILQTDDKPIRRIGLLIVSITFGLFGGWAALAPLDSAALATGIVTVKNYRKTVQHLEGGIVKEIYVRDGDSVEPGQVLVELDDTQARAQLEIMNGQMISVKALEARLVAERDSLESVEYPDSLRLSNDPRAIDAIKGQNQVFDARKRSWEGETSVLEQRIEQLKVKVSGIREVQKSKDVLIVSYDDEIQDLRALLSDGYTDKQRLRELERNRARLVGEIAESQSAVAEAEIKIGETRLQILQLKKDFRTDVVNKLGEIQAKSFDLTERVAATKDKVTRTSIIAPVSGMVLEMAVHTVGGVVAPGSRILDIVPQTGELVVEAQISPIDIDRVQPGNLAEIRFSAFKSATTPVIGGRVITLSADRLVNEQSGMPYYLARVEITEEGSASLGSLKLIPGMPAEVLVNTGERTLLEYMLQPLTNAVARSMIED